jgi:glycosyltransferase involved in cell wall biosynthesis
MPRALLVCATGQLGGAERSLVELAAAINPSRYELCAVVGSTGPLTEELEAVGVRTEIVEMQRLQRTVNPLKLAEYVAAIARSSRRIADAARSLNADVIHSNSDMAHVYVGEAAERAKLPCIWHVRDMVNLGPIGDRMAKQATRIIAISEAVRDHLERSGVPAEKVRLVRNGIALARFAEGPERDEMRRSARTSLSIDPFCFLAGAAGAFVPWKRHEDFIRAFWRLCELEVTDRTMRPDGPGSTVVELKGLIPARGVLFGEDLLGDHGRYVFDLRRLADELVGERVAFAGWRKDLASLLPALDVFVSPSEGEPFGRVVVEAMAAALPVIATDSGGKREIVVDGKTGYLVPSGDIDAIAEAMNTFRREPAMRAEMGSAGRSRAQELFAVERTARETEAVYDELLSTEPADGSA